MGEKDKCQLNGQLGGHNATSWAKRSALEGPQKSASATHKKKWIPTIFKIKSLWELWNCKCPEFVRQSASGKFCPNQELFISSKSFQSVDIENKLTFFIWNYGLEVLNLNEKVMKS
jgi:hypothetical protein